jgi:PAS domain S-box-containing protein
VELETDHGDIRVLLVEDDPDDYYLTQELLADVPGGRFALDWSSNFEDGLKSMVSCGHDAYLLDYRLGARNGIELMRDAVRQGCKGPVILLTGQGDRELAIEALEAGAADYLVKGKFDAEALERAIRYALQQKRYADELERKVRDRTAELARINSELRESELRFRMVADNMSQLAWTADSAGGANWFNKRWLDYTGLTLDEARGREWLRVVHPDHLERVNESIGTVAALGEIWEETFPMRSANGEYRWFLSQAVPIRDNGELRWFGTSTDITELRKAERAINEREMLERIVKFQEAERHRIARDLHDHLGQQLTGLRLAMLDMRESVEKGLDVREKVAKAEESAKTLDKDFSLLAFELRASVLSDQTLVEALASFVAEWSRNYGVEAEFTASGTVSNRLPDDVETNLYRITQEALHNILKHAKATRVDVVLTQLPGEIRLNIEDDGVGFDYGKMRDAHPDRDHRLGLTGMEERARLIGGSIEIDSQVGAGTSILVRVPVV